MGGNKSKRVDPKSVSPIFHPPNVEQLPLSAVIERLAPLATSGWGHSTSGTLLSLLPRDLFSQLGQYLILDRSPILQIPTKSSPVVPAERHLDTHFTSAVVYLVSTRMADIVQYSLHTGQLHEIPHPFPGRMVNTAMCGEELVLASTRAAEEMSIIANLDPEHHSWSTTTFPHLIFSLSPLRCNPRWVVLRVLSKKAEYIWDLNTKEIIRDLSAALEPRPYYFGSACLIWDSLLLESEAGTQHLLLLVESVVRKSFIYSMESSSILYSVDGMYTDIVPRGLLASTFDPPGRLPLPIRLHTVFDGPAAMEIALPLDPSVSDDHVCWMEVFTGYNVVIVRTTGVVVVFNGKTMAQKTTWKFGCVHPRAAISSECLRRSDLYLACSSWSLKSQTSSLYLQLPLQLEVWNVVTSSCVLVLSDLRPVVSPSLRVACCGGHLVLYWKEHILTWKLA